LRRIIARSPLARGAVRVVDDDGQALARLLPEHGGRDLLLALHEAVPAGLLDLVGYDRQAEIVRAGALDRLVLEAAGAIDPRLLEPVEQHLEILVRLARKADDEGRAQGEIGAFLPPAADALQRLFLVRRSAHVLQHCRRS